MIINDLNVCPMCPALHVAKCTNDIGGFISRVDGAIEAAALQYVQLAALPDAGVRGVRSVADEGDVLEVTRGQRQRHRESQ